MSKARFTPQDISYIIDVVMKQSEVLAAELMDTFPKYPDLAIAIAVGVLIMATLDKGLSNPAKRAMLVDAMNLGSCHSGYAVSAISIH